MPKKLTKTQRQLLQLAKDNPVRVSGPQLRTAKALQKMGFGEILVGGSGVAYNGEWWWEFADKSYTPREPASKPTPKDPEPTPKDPEPGENPSRPSRPSGRCYEIASDNRKGRPPEWSISAMEKGKGGNRGRNRDIGVAWESKTYDGVTYLKLKLSPGVVLDWRMTDTHIVTLFREKDRKRR